MEFTFLGTGAAVPSRERNVSALAVNFAAHGGDTWLFDCGEATQHQILETAIKPTKITKLFLTHLHGDHLFGLPGFLCTRSVYGNTTPLTIYAPAGVAEYIDISLRTSGAYLRFPLEIIELTDGLQLTIDDVRVTVGLLEHGIPSYGFRLELPDKPGKLNQTRLVADGIPPGPLYQQLKQGEIITLADGRTINGKDYVSAPIQGRILSIFGDTRPTKTTIELAQNADLMIHEATFEAALAEKAYKHFHSTTVQAAEMAREANVKQLILTHLSSRYQEANTDALLAEATTIFPQTQLAQDFWTYSL